MATASRKHRPAVHQPTAHGPAIDGPATAGSRPDPAARSRSDAAHDDTGAPRLRLKSPKAASAAECLVLEQLPNVGPSMAADLRALGIARPQALSGRDPLALYRALERHTGKRQDPCVLDTLMAVIDFMQGAAPAPWWAYTARRKALHGQLDAGPAAHRRSAAASRRTERALSPLR